MERKTIFNNSLSQKARFSIRSNLDLDSNITKKSDPHEAKHFAPKSVTEAEITTVMNRVPQKIPFQSATILTLI
jgi:hypothetical protein